MRFVTLLACVMSLSCVASSRIGYISYIDTRGFVGFRTDGQETSAALLSIYREAYPNESAACLYGEVKDTVYLGERGLLAIITKVEPANVMAVGVDYVIPPDVDPLKLCKIRRDFLGISHSHLIVSPLLPCVHTQPNDVNVLSHIPRAMLSIVICSDGRGHLLWQDGRSTGFIWGERKKPPTP